MRAEIQALRAFAVLAVVLYHLWPGRLPGGYVGVDVFFAISGFLIIGHLLRDIERNGRVSLTRFWAKRARRLLPASLVVLVVTGVATVLWVPTTLWQQWFKEIAASAVYVQNWVLSLDAVDYLGAENDPSAVQHFWSLSVEEQFYILWPIVIVLLLALSRRYPAVPARRSIAVVLVLLTAASFASSVAGVANDPAAAYFVTQSRAWEFGAGGILALVASAERVDRPAVRAVVSWLGIAALAVTVLAFTAETPFPGWAALLPVLGALAVIWAGTPRIAWGPSALMRLRPVQWVGDVSYSLYLWHWPLLVIAPYALGHDLGLRSSLLILAASFLLAWVTKVLVEDPVRNARVLTARPARVTLTATVTATLMVVGVTGTGYVRTGQDIAAAAVAAEQQLEQDRACAGAMAVVSGCADPHAPNGLTNPMVAAGDIGRGVQMTDECKQTLEEAAILSCTVGDTTEPSRTIALIGDSHAGAFLEALDLYGRDNGVKILTYVKTWCAGTGASGVGPRDYGTAAGNESCARWGNAVLDTVAADPAIEAAVFTNFTQGYSAPASNGFGRPVTPADFEQAWARLDAAGKKVIALRDVPNAGNVNVPDCIAQHLDEDDPCATPLAGAGLPRAADPVLLAAAASGTVTAIDIDDVFCDDQECHTLIGGLVAYFDTHHMTATFARTLAPVVGERILQAMG
ncbi:acyltransferase family protein [Planctomonas deserti]|uniref:acyltransferase family protein n=1 Tax=Planctomonas deserti TaxID=2144185 RepID=UPI000D33B08F|nr:acyltransferase family protein [Planctomonas deserti]